MPRVRSSPAPLCYVLEQDINPSLVLIQPRKTRHFITERLLMGRKESDQTNKKIKMFAPCNLPIKYICFLKANTLVACIMSACRCSAEHSH